MSGEVAEVPRPRPLSGGLWTLFSWLRRDDRSSSESLSSAGSDRTAASFAFLPARHPRPRAAPSPPPSPPTDSYRKRVRERSLRRQHDRDLTLHRKYGLLRGDGGHDAFRSLGDAGLGPQRERRAASEAYERRAAHVPGKRRAPPPPATLPAALSRRNARKRPAPQPPVSLDRVKENKPPMEPDKTNVVQQMNSNSTRDRRPLSSTDSFMGCKSEKYSKKDNDQKDSKPRTEKSFLKQIFENRKRNSAIEAVPTKILPNISELDRQAAEIIESCKLKSLEQNNNFTETGMLSKGDMWFCTRCLRKYNSTVVTCLYCLPEQKKLTNGLVKDSCKNSASNASNIYTRTEKETSSNISTGRVNGISVDEKQKLKEMLKEMKDSLPKRPKQDKNKLINSKKIDSSSVSNEENVSTMETPTLRIGSVITNESSNAPVSQPSSSKELSEPSRVKISSPPLSSEELGEPSRVKPTSASVRGPISNNVKLAPVSDTVVITHRVVLVAPQSKDKIQSGLQRSNYVENTSKPSTSVINLLNSSKIAQSENAKLNKDSNESANIHVIEKPNVNNPLKISSLLNPVYIPKHNISEGQIRRSLFFSQIHTKNSAEKDIAATPVKTISNDVQLVSSTSLLDSPSTPQSHVKKLQSSTLIEIKPKEESKANQSQLASLMVTTPIKSIVPHKDHMESKQIPLEKKLSKNLVSTASSTANTPSTSNSKLSGSNMVRLSVDQHSRRRDLINQLEQSIAKGDEKAAAEAAAKLAQLRLSCSVLSFSSQIAAAEKSKLTPNATTDKNVAKIDRDQKSKPEKAASKVINVIQSTSGLPKDNSAKLCVNREETRIIVDEGKPSSLLRPNIEPVNNKLNEKTAGETALREQLSPGPSTSRQHTETENNMASIDVWVEDREATRGPVRLDIGRQAVMGDLRRQAETSLGLAARLQRWIVGRALCTNDSTPLVSLAGPNLTAPFYLCLVESESNTEAASQVKTDKTVNNTVASTDGKHDDKATDVYSELVQLELHALVSNTEPFECGVCMEQCLAAGGAVLRECVHIFCRNCLADLVRHCEEPAVSCPAMGCSGVLQEREIRALVSPEEYERWLARGLAAAESGTRNAFHCRTRDCSGWALCDPGVRRFPCPVCKHINCVSCQAIHEGQTCEQHRIKLQESTAASDTNQADEGTLALLDTLITKGEALQCPECSAIITKKWGCDWVKCSACKTEICWVTRGRRWGPGGRGDTSGGCRCGIDGKRCHPTCGYCH